MSLVCICPKGWAAKTDPRCPRCNARAAAQVVRARRDVKRFAATFSTIHYKPDGSRW